MFKNYLKIAVRNFTRHKAYSAINILGLAVGMAGCIIIMQWVLYERSFDRFHKNAERICRVNNQFKMGNNTGSKEFPAAAAPLVPAIKEELPEVLEYTRLWPLRYYDVGPHISAFKKPDLQEPYHIKGVFYADASIFRLFSFSLAAGDAESALSEPYSLVLSEQSANHIFGEEDPVGKVLTCGGTPYTVTAVAEDLPENSHLQFQALVSINSIDQETRNRWGNVWMATYLLLENGTDLQALEEKINILYKKYNPQPYEGSRHVVQPFLKIHLYSSHQESLLGGEFNYRNVDVKRIYLFSSLAMVILLIACINFVNLSTARSAVRAREVALRKVVGARRSQLIVQFVGESICMCLIAMVFALALVELTWPLVISFSPGLAHLNSTSSSSLILWVTLICLLVGVLAGVYPAIVISAFKPATVFRGTFSCGSNRGLLRKSLVVLQFIATVVLIVCSLTIYRQMIYIGKKELGFDKNQVILTENLWLGPKADAYKRLKLDLLEHTGISDVTASLGRFGTVFPEGESIFYENQQPDGISHSGKLYVDHNFIDFYGLELVAGRNFSPEVSTDYRNAYIINESLQKALGWEDPIGKKFSQYGRLDGKVIGVVKDFHFNSLHQPIGPFFMAWEDRYSCYSVKVKPENIASTIELIKKKWQEHVPDLPFEYSFLDETFERIYREDKMAGLTVGIFSLLAIFVACLGLFGLISFSVQQRTKEIGIRKTMGASVAQIVLLLSREFMILFGIAILVAWPVAWYFMDRWLQDFAYRIELGPGAFVLGAVLALIIALLTVSFQAVKAAYANPVEALRYE